MPGKIIFINRFYYPDFSATSQLLSDLSFSLVGRGYRVSVITSNSRYDGGGSPALLPEENIFGVQVHRCRGSNFGRDNLLGRTLDYCSFYILAMWRVLKIVKRGDLVVVKTDPPLLGVFLGPVIRLRGARQINWFQDLFPEIASGLNVRWVTGGISWFLCFLRDWSCRAATANVVIGHRMARYLSERGISEEKLAVIPNWGPDGIRPVDHKHNTLRKKWGIEDQFVIGYSGNLGRAHDWQSLLALIDAFNGMSGICFLFIGGGVGMQLLAQKVAESGYKHVLFQPYQPREVLSQSLSAIDLHLVTLEPLLGRYLVPSKIYGAAAAGRPVVFIGPDESEIADLLRNYGFGRVVANGELERLSEVVQELVKNSSEYKACAEHAISACEKEFSFGCALLRWTALIQKFV